MTRLRQAAWIALLLLALLPGCSTFKSLFEPKRTPQEKKILEFNVQGIYLDSPPSHLTIFSQVKKDPKKRNGMDLFEVYNPNAHISMMLCWYLEKSMRQMELRYFDGGGVQTLTISGGWEAIRDDLIRDLGPPSRFGPEVPVVATMSDLDPMQAAFNGQWIFSRVHRTLSFIAFESGDTGIAVLTIQDTTPPTKKQLKKEKPFPQAESPPGSTTPGPGFSFGSSR